MALGMGAAALILISGFAILISDNLPLRRTPPQELEPEYNPRIELTDFTGQLRYGKDKSTGLCFVNIRTADTDQRLWRTFAHVPCEALEGLER